MERIVSCDLVRFHSKIVAALYQMVSKDDSRGHASHLSESNESSASFRKDLCLSLDKESEESLCNAIVLLIQSAINEQSVIHAAEVLRDEQQAI